MECRDIKILLSDYIDQVLDSKTASLVKDHLLSCKECAQELENLKSGILKIKSLNSIKAPEDFLQKVHKRIEEKSEFERIVSKIFSTPKIRIPVEAVGVFVTVVLVVAVFRFMNPEGKPTYYPQVNEQMISRPEPAKPVEYPAPKDLFKEKNSVPTITATEKLSIQKRDVDVLAKAPTQSLSLGAVAGSVNYRRAGGLAKSSVRNMAGVAQRSDTMQTESFDEAALVEQDKSLQKSETLGDYSSDSSDARSVVTAKETPAEKKPEILLTIDSSKIALSDCVAKIRSIVEARSGTIESVEIDGSGVKNIISVKIPTITYARFIRELAQMGTVQVGVFAVKLQEKYLSLKVEIAVSQ